MANLISNIDQFANIYATTDDLELAVMNDLRRYHNVADDLQAAETWVNDLRDGDNDREMLSHDVQTFSVHGIEDEKYNYIPVFRVIITEHYLDGASADDEYIYTVRVTEL